MIATTKSGCVAFGVALVNNTTNTLNRVNVSFLGELWRNNPAQQVIDVGYAIDPAGTNSMFNPATMALTPVNALNVAFPTSALTTINDGTQSTNQLSLATNSMPIADWSPGSTLWLVWKSQNPAGGAQDVAIDDLSFSAAPNQPVVSGPANLTVVAGATVFAPEVGGAPPLSYQWHKGASPLADVGNVS